MNTNSNNQEAKNYLQNNIKVTLESLVSSLIKEKPKDPVKLQLKLTTLTKLNKLNYFIIRNTYD